MNSKLLSAIAALGLLAASQAHAAAPFTGPYVNGFLGLANPTTTIDASWTGGSFSTELGDPMLSGGGLVGWGFGVGKFVLAPEAGAEKMAGSIDAANVSINGNDYSLKAEADYTVAATVKAGYLVNDNTLAFVRAGWVHSSFSATCAITGGTCTGSDRSFNGARLGLGAEFKVVDPLAVRLDYTYDIYGSEKFTYPTYSTEYTPRVSTMRVGVSYYFN